MKRTLLTLAGIALLAVPSASAAGGATLVIDHVKVGCHSWSLNGDKLSVSQTARLARGGTLTVTDNDVMPHLLLQTGGPAKAAIARVASSVRDVSTSLRGPGLMAHMGASVKVSFAKAGTYTFTTKEGDDYVKGIETVGPDHVLKLKVVVS